ncbi:Crp/Fnr family transcriptional regulator [Deinococcus aquiradiocola]|uniref:Transcriptional regulator LdrP n=1 Tax=Deinococcus aquiradiocola TaxID=393059 RepID=A0A917PD79_9DEIO|nr:helix-turn-helix domain-containing protein [Deinococcus aquiradiocola]GGJ71592.1 transcriptional regulator LdrP [Deinococcus aquiradiocola]
MSAERDAATPARIRVARGERIYAQGETTRVLYRADTGLIRLYQVTPRGRTVTLRHVLPGDYFGEDSLVAPGQTPLPHRYSAEALTSASLYVYDPAALSERELLDLSRSMGQQLRRAMLHEVHLQSGDLKHRVVRYLLELSDTPLGSEDADNRLYVRATHELLAEGSGSTRESVSKVVTDLRDAGLVETGYRHITLLDLSALRELAGLDLLSDTETAHPGPGPTRNLT